MDDEKRERRIEKYSKHVRLLHVCSVKFCVCAYVKIKRQKLELGLDSPLACALSRLYKKQRTNVVITL